VDCDQIQAAIGQYQDADADDFSAIAQELGVSQNQVLACFQSLAAGRDVNIGASASAATATATATASAAASASASALPSTGGVSVPGAIALGAGVLLVAGGLLARRIVR
jgi:LPXTG-motif cell wall-anchored protein